MAFSTLPFRRLHPDARLPVRRFAADAGLDLFTIGTHIIPRLGVLTVPTGLAVAIPEGFYGQIEGRSGLASRGVQPLGGCIDSGFTGEIGIILHNTTDKPVTVGADGKAVAQLVVHRVELPTAKWADELPTTDRGAGGFGSTDGHLSGDAA